jgi:hypothetical protein
MQQFKIMTKFGALMLTPTSDDHIHATTNPTGGRLEDLLPWTINGKTYNFIKAHAHREGEQWKLRYRDKDDVWQTGLYFSEGTPSAQKQALNELERAITQWANSAVGKLALHRADVERVEHELAQQQYERETAARELAEAEEGVATLQHELDHLRSITKFFEADAAKIELRDESDIKVIRARK